MALVFKTAKDAPHDVEILGVGTLGAYGKGGRPVSDAALVMTELHERDEQGRLKTDKDGNVIPLTGSKLATAAKQFAEDRGLEVVNVAEDKLDDLPREMGAPADRPPAHEVAAQKYKEIYGDLVPEYNNPEEQATNPTIAVGQAETHEKEDN